MQPGPAASGRFVRCLAATDYRKGKLVIIRGMAAPALHQVLMATENTHTHMQHSCPTEQHGSYLPSRAAKIPLCIEKTDKQRLFGSDVLESKCLIGCGCGSVSWSRDQLYHTCQASDPKQDTPIAPPTIAAFIREPSSSAKTE